MSRAKHRMVCFECKQFLNKLNSVINSKPSLPLAAMINELQGHLAMLDQAWSTMAGRNLINDVLRTLVKMEHAVPPAAKADLLALKAVVQKAVFAHQITNSRYDSVVCLGWRIKVAGNSYTGKTDDWQDMQQRCENMKTAIRAAYNIVDPVIRSDQRVLKIFMAPEFYFRGRNGAYDFNEINGIAEVKGGNGIAPAAAKKGLLELMADEIDKSIYKDWLFVLGTAIGATKATKDVCGNCGGDVKYEKAVGGKTKAVCRVDPKHSNPTVEKVLGAQVDNVAFVYKEKQLYTVAKELVSGVDYIKDKSAGKTNVVNVGKDSSSKEELDVMWTATPSGYHVGDSKPTKFTDERMGGSIFTIDGVRFGLEVCLDHAATAGNAATGRLAGASNIQVQLIPSAGMCIGSLSTIPYGIVFNVDGSIPHVQAIGQKVGSNGLELNSAVQDGFDNRKYHVNVGPFPGLGGLMDVYSSGNYGSSWKTHTVPQVAAGTGKVFMYGPYELP